MNAKEHSIEAATKLIQDNPGLFNKFADKELQVNIIALAMLKFSVEQEKREMEEREEKTDNGLHPLFNKIIDNHFKTKTCNK